MDNDQWNVSIEDCVRARSTSPIIDGRKNGKVKGGARHSLVLRWKAGFIKGKGYARLLIFFSFLWIFYDRWDLESLPHNHNNYNP